MTRRLRVLALASLLLAAPGGEAASQPRDWERTVVPAAGRLLAVAAPGRQPSGPVLTVVFEGDGAGHDVRGRPTGDPTPRRPLGLAIARRWPAGEGEGPRVWIGRLCQYVRAEDARCGQADWTTARFSETAVAAADAAVDRMKTRTGAARVRLVGWSGGGTLAMLVAQRRSDVSGVVTMAAPLDLRAWTDGRGLSPLTGSLDPSLGGWAGARPAQVHLLGAFDPIAPPRDAADPARRLAGPGGVVSLLPEEHVCCWARRAAEAARMIKALEQRR